MCGFIFWNNPKPVVSIIIHNKNKILLLQRANEPFKDFWVLPGGFIGYSETAQDAIIREVKEETGLEVTVEQPIGVYRIDTDPRGIHIDIVFAAESAQEPTISKEHTSWKFFCKDTLPDNIAYKHRQAILDWYNKQI
jgi:ADP-ribose pyrophosphatase YjhB (NUDIX family)